MHLSKYCESRHMHEHQSPFMQLHACSLPTLIAISAAIGTAASVAFGSSSQLVARFPPSCGQALALGIVSSGPLVLLLQFLLALGPHPTAMQQIVFFHIASLFPLASLVFTVWLLRRYWTPLQAGNILLPFTRTVQVTPSAYPTTNTNANANASPGLTRPQSNSSLWAMSNFNTANVQPSQQPQRAPSAPGTPLVPFHNSKPYEDDAESLILGNLSIPDMDCEAQDSLHCFGPASQPVASMHGSTSAAPPVDDASVPLLAAHPAHTSVPESMPDSMHAPLLSAGVLPDLHITLPDITQHPLLPSVPMALEVPWSPAASVPGAVTAVQPPSTLDNTGANVVVDSESDLRRRASVSSQYASEIAEASGFWLTHVGTPREGAVVVGTPPLDGSVSSMPLVPTDQLSAGGSMRRGSLTHSMAGTADSGWPQVPSAPLPPLPQQQQPHCATAARAGSTLKSVAWNVAPVALCLWSSMTVSVMLFPVFTVVRSSGALGCMLPQALFAVRMVSDISGRVLASARQPPVSIVGIAAALKTAMLPAAVLYLWAPPKFLSDAAALLFVMFHWILSGLVGAWSFMLLPRFFAGPESAAYAGTVMSAAFQGGTIAGLVLATLLEYVFKPPSSHLTPLIC